VKPLSYVDFTDFFGNLAAKQEAIAQFCLIILPILL
jgi:hypothetical protein